MLSAFPMRAARECRDGAASIRRGHELPAEHARRLEAIAAQLEELESEMHQTLNELPRPALEQYERGEPGCDFREPEFEDDDWPNIVPVSAHLGGSR